MKTATAKNTERQEFLKKIANKRFKHAQLLDGSGFVGIKNSWVENCSHGELAVFSCVRHSEDTEETIFTEADLKNFVL